MGESVEGRGEAELCGFSPVQIRRYSLLYFPHGASLIEIEYGPALRKGHYQLARLTYHEGDAMGRKTPLAVHLSLLLFEVDAPAEGTLQLPVFIHYYLPLHQTGSPQLNYIFTTADHVPEDPALEPGI